MTVREVFEKDYNNVTWFRGSLHGGYENAFPYSWARRLYLLGAITLFTLRRHLCYYHSMQLTT